MWSVATELQHAVGMRRFAANARLKAVVIAPPHDHVEEGKLVVLLPFKRELDSGNHFFEDSKEVILLPVDNDKRVVNKTHSHLGSVFVQGRFLQALKTTSDNFREPCSHRRSFPLLLSVALLH